MAFKATLRDGSLDPQEIFKTTTKDLSDKCIELYYKFFDELPDNRLVVSLLKENSTDTFIRNIDSRKTMTTKAKTLEGWLEEVINAPKDFWRSSPNYNIR